MTHDAILLVVLPQQLGIDLGIRHRGTGKEYRSALLRPQFANKAGPPVPVRMGHHAFDGSFSQIAFVPLVTVPLTFTWQPCFLWFRAQFQLVPLFLLHLKDSEALQ